MVIMKVKEQKNNETATGFVNKLEHFSVQANKWATKLRQGKQV